MAKRLKKSAPSAGDALARQVTDSAQKIWLAGLGAFAKAQDGGGKVFETLVTQGKEIERKTRQVAEKAMEAAKAQATETVSKAAGKLDKLEQVFEDRVQRSLNRIGVLTRKDVDELTRQVLDLSQSMRALIAQEKGSSQRTRAKAPAEKTAAKPRAKRAAGAANPAPGKSL